jgi:hypothetical protein
MVNQHLSPILLLFWLGLPSRLQDHAFYGKRRFTTNHSMKT